MKNIWLVALSHVWIISVTFVIKLIGIPGKSVSIKHSTSLFIVSSSQNCNICQCFQTFNGISSYIKIFSIFNKKDKNHNKRRRFQGNWNWLLLYSVCPSLRMLHGQLEIVFTICTLCWTSGMGHHTRTLFHFLLNFQLKIKQSGKCTSYDCFQNNDSLICTV